MKTLVASHEHWDIVDFWQLVTQNRDAGQRHGQACFNALATLDLELADLIRGTALDPFYDDSKVPAFLAEIFGE